MKTLKETNFITLILFWSYLFCSISLYFIVKLWIIAAFILSNCICQNALLEQLTVTNNPKTIESSCLVSKEYTWEQFFWSSIPITLISIWTIFLIYWRFMLRFSYTIYQQKFHSIKWDYIFFFWLRLTFLNVSSQKEELNSLRLKKS